jgi:hypothetical protein
MPFNLGDCLAARMELGTRRSKIRSRLRYFTLERRR